LSGAACHDRRFVDAAALRDVAAWHANGLSGTTGDVDIGMSISA
jgi:hypothetical protein